MRFLVLIAHGSRREDSNREVRELGERLAAISRVEVDGVRCGFLELAQPSIPDAIGECVAAGGREILVLPYFLSAGRHVSEDIPREVNLASARYPNARIRVLDYLGADPAVPELLLGCVRRAQSSPRD